MKLRLTVSKVYDVSDEKLLKEYADWVGTYARDLQNLQEFLCDRFIDPHFDRDTDVQFEIVTGDEDDDDN